MRSLRKLGAKRQSARKCLSELDFAAFDRTRTRTDLSDCPTANNWQLACQRGVAGVDEFVRSQCRVVRVKLPFPSVGPRPIKLMPALSGQLRQRN